MIKRLTVIVVATALSLISVHLLTAASAAANPQISGTYLGGELPDHGSSIAVDEAGNVFLTGRTESTNFPTGTVSLPGSRHGIDAYVAKFNNDGSQAEYILWFFTAALFEFDAGYSVVVDEAGHAYVVGQTGSSDFCSLMGNAPGYDTEYNGTGDGFLLKLAPDGSLVYCTFLGGTELDSATAVALDATGNAYVSGGTWSTDFITSSSTINDQHAGLRDVYLVKVDATGTAVLHSSLLGGTGQEETRGIALDSDENVYITGWTNSNDFITTTGVIGTQFGGSFDAFLVKINTTTPDLLFSTYIGGADEDRGFGLGVDDQGHSYIGGLTRSDNFPTTPQSYDTELSGSGDGFVIRVNETATDIIFGTYLGGGSEDAIHGLTLDEAQKVLVTGVTWSDDFPFTADAFSQTLTGGRSAFVTRLQAGGDDLDYSTYLGGDDWDEGNAITTGAGNHVYVTGATESSNFPVSPNAFATENAGNKDIFFSNFILTSTNILSANFSATPTAGPAPLTTSFLNLSSGIYQTSTWEFGDGSSSDLQNPAHIYELPGRYTVTLTVIGPTGSSTLVKTDYVLVLSPTYLPFIVRP